ncbi:MAG: LysM peptidoglycan-binding domain-containing protein [Bacillus sp. (in: firmicutes)]
MQIYVVRSGDSVYTIAQAFNSTPQNIITANQLSHPNELVVGQALVIPINGSFYWVQPGDSLYSIAQRFGLSAQELARINGLNADSQLAIGAKLYIPPPAQKPYAAFNGYIEPRGSAVSETLIKAAEDVALFLTYLAPFSFEVQRDGSLKEPLMDNFPNIAEDNGAVLTLVLTNLENGSFSTDLGRVILNDQTVQNRLIDNILAAVNKYTFSDVHFDFERLRAQDSKAYPAFLQKVKNRLSGQKITISAALAPKMNATQKGEYYEGHDFGAIGAVVDFAVIMTYEWGYSGGPAQAVSPINPVRQVLQYTLSEMPAYKIMMGQNLYGYDWTLPFKPGTTARAVSPQQAIDLARRHQVNIQYDNVAQAPFFRYRDRSGRAHEVWFEDARSIQAKFDLVKQLSLRGVSYWKLGLSFPQNWLLIDNNFNILKR